MEFVPQYMFVLKHMGIKHLMSIELAGGNFLPQEESAKNRCQARIC